jgi:hypothetical protein
MKSGDKRKKEDRDGRWSEGTRETGQRKNFACFEQKDRTDRLTERGIVHSKLLFCMRKRGRDRDRDRDRYE